jgi:Domain of Unknown Function (DUF1080)
MASATRPFRSGTIPASVSTPIADSHFRRPINVTLNQLVLIGSILLLTPAFGRADEGGEAFTDVKSAGADFALQGEYTGNVETEDGLIEWGAQVIALGDTRFTIVGYQGGLPGDGWNRGDKTTTIEGQAIDGVINTESEAAQIKIASSGISIIVDGKEIGTLKRVDRSSPTLGAKPPAGATVLFDGSSADQFENGKLVEGNLLGATNCTSKQKFADHHLHIEFRTPFMPKARGQGRGNSGVYMQGRYELQVLDSFGLKGENNECGGIYSISEPIVNMCLPPLTWQTYEIDFTAAKFDNEGKKIKNARATIKHNGVVIHDDLELTHGTPGYHDEGPEPDSLFLQDHGNPVAFRNIWVVEK